MNTREKYKVITVTFDNRTNRVFYVKYKNAHTRINTGELARDVFTTLLGAGYKQRAALRGDIYSVIGFTKKYRSASC
ncbi:hypothetical protein [Alicyclobacillus sp. ALC3]|uniref:hypothetical protein n=1 Tax=Alicyclobacillus sp. ALC3 TaxID=2796143 RepID=UPI0023782B72|nr:hypothetical protein [Alicyclobacillus sp. ALC3]WDL98353.1 hypothetical protein JC200_06610 [Alicyclobacillus sp. ALC3]